MSSAPPPIQPPKISTPVHRSSWPTVAVIGILCVFLFTLVVGGLLYVGLRIQPRMRKGAGDRVVGVPIRNGWARYHIPSIGLSIASNRQLAPALELGKSITASSGISEYAGYGAKGPHLRCEIVAHWMRSVSSLSHVADLEQLYWQRLHPNYSSSRRTPIVVAGVAGNMITVDFMYKGYAWTVKEAVFIRGKVHYFLYGMYWNSKDRWGERVYDYMLRSVQFDLPGGLVRA